MKINQILMAVLVLMAVACGKDQKTEESLNSVASTASVAASTNAEVDEHAGHNHGNEAEAKVESNGKMAKFEFVETEHNFGDIMEGDVVEHVFKFKNTGEVPLVITNTRVTCGCTTPSYTKDPVAPGETGELQVKFNSAGKSGNQTKVVTIMANVEGGQDKVTIFTNIKPKSTGGPVAN